MANERFKSRVLRQIAPPVGAKHVKPVAFEENATCQLGEYLREPPEVCDAAPLWMVRSCEHQAAVHASKDEDNAAPFCIDDRSRVSVVELLFPGDQNEPVKNKWIYVFPAEGGDPVVEVYAGEAKKGDSSGWRSCENPPADAAQRKLAPMGDNTIPLKDGRYRFFLSPIRLSVRSLDVLKKNLKVCGVEHDVRPDTLSLIVPVPDPFRWAEDCHDKFFAPRLADYAAWATDDEVKAADMIWGMIDTWRRIDEDGKLTQGKARPDEGDVWDDVDQQEYKTFRQEFDRHEKYLMRRVNNAGAYLADWIDSQWHRVVELAGTETDTAGLYRTCLHWAYVSRDLNCTEPTRALLESLLEKKQRFLWTHIFAGSQGGNSPWDEKLPLNQKTSEHPVKLAGSIAKAIVGTFANGYPAFLKLKPDKAYVSAMAMRKALIEEMDQMFDWWKLARRGATKKAIQAMERAGFNPAKVGMGGIWVGGAKVHGAGNLRRAIFKKKFEFRGHDAAAKKAIRQLEATDSKRLVKFFGSITLPLDMVLGLSVAYIELRGAMKRYRLAQGTSADNAVSMAGAAIDAAQQVAAISMFLSHLCRSSLSLRKALSNAASMTNNSLGRLAPALLIVSGVLEIISRIDKIGDDAARQDYGRIAGHVVALVGAALMIAGGVLMIKGAAAGAAAGSAVPGAGTAAGAVVGFIGGLIVAIGSWIALTCQKSELEQYVRSSCFGDTEGDIEASWADQPLNRARKPSIHRRNLYLFMANFRVKVTEDGFDGKKPKASDRKYLLIEPGFMSNQACFRILVYEKLNRFAPAKVTLHEISPATGKATSLFCPSLDVADLPKSKAVKGLVDIEKKGKNGQERVRICVACPHHQGSFSPEDFRAITRLEAPGKKFGLPETIPPPVKAETTPDGKKQAAPDWRVSTDLTSTSDWVSSLDRDEQVNFAEWADRAHRRDGLTTMEPAK